MAILTINYEIIPFQTLIEKGPSNLNLKKNKHKSVLTIIGDSLRVNYFSTIALQAIQI